MSRPPCTDAHIAADGLLASRCWCEAMKVRVTPEDVRRGRTVSCGADLCEPDWQPEPSEWVAAWFAQHTRKAR